MTNYRYINNHFHRRSLDGTTSINAGLTMWFLQSTFKTLQRQKPITVRLPFQTNQPATSANIVDCPQQLTTRFHEWVLCDIVHRQTITPGQTELIT